MHRRQTRRGGSRHSLGAHAPQPANRSGEDVAHGDYDSLGARCARFGVACCLRFVVPVLLLLALAGGLGYFRLAQGPASLKFLVGPVERGIGAEFDGLNPKIDDVVVALTPGGGLEFQLQNLRLFDVDESLVATAPSAAMQLSASALWSGRITPSKVVFIEPRVFLAYSSGEGLTLSFSPADKNAQSGERLEQVGPNSNAQLSGADPSGSELGSGRALKTKRIDVARMVAEATERARGGGAASSYLRELGFRDATVVIDHEGHLSAWQVPRLSVDLDHKQSSSIVSGYAAVTSPRGPWTMSFRLEDSVEARSFDVTVAVRGLVPRTLGEVLPSLALLKPFDMPLDGDAKFTVARLGGLSTGHLDLQIGRGRVFSQTLSYAPLEIDAGLIRLGFDARARKIVLEPSTLRWGESSLTLVGEVLGASKPQTDAVAGGQQVMPWNFDIRAQQGVVSVAEFGVPPLPIENWQALGQVWPSRSLIELQSLNVAAGGGEVTITGSVDSSATSPGTHIQSKLSAMPVALLKALWPRGFADGARKWFGRRVSDGQVKSGTFKFVSGRYMRELQQASVRETRTAMAVELADVKMQPVADGPVLSATRALVRLENNALEVVVPEAVVKARDGEVVVLKAGRFTAVDLNEDDSVGEIVFKVKSKVTPVLALMMDPAINVVQKSDVPLKGVSGDIKGDVSFSFPLHDGVELSDAKVGGKLRLSNGRAEDVFGSYDVQGATLDFDINEGAMDVRGEILLAGVLSKVNWQRIFSATNDKQPPLRITATLDNSDRRQLGITFGEAVLGDVPVELTITPKAGANSQVHFRADLTNADLFVESIAWRKPPGRSAFLECDVVSGERYYVLLKNLRVAGDDIGVEGWAGVDKDNKFVAFEFPKFSLDLVSRLKVSGRVKKGPVWVVNAKGPTFDGRAFFKTLFSVGRVTGRPDPKRKPGEGIDFSADVDTVLGYGDVSLKGMSLKMSKRGGRLTVLKVRGKLSGGAPLAVDYIGGAALPGGKPRERRLVADSLDAGDVFRLVGFYPNLQGGKMRLEVQLDGRGAAEKTGTLWVDKFQVLGDAVVSEVFSNSQDGMPSIAAGSRGRRKTVREVFQFDRMRAPFSVGHGQFVLDDASVNGPILGATLRGKVDYSRRVLDIGGTYVPLQGLNNAFGEIPLLGELLSGPRGEGIFGMTFAIQGDMGNPQVIVNPFSFVAPGILREIFQMTPQAPTIQPRTQRRKKTRANWDVRNSSATVSGTSITGQSQWKDVQPSDRTVDGWSARTTGQ